MEKYLGKKYKLKSSDKFDEYLQFIGVNYVSRKLGTSLSPVCELVKNDDGSYSLVVNTAVRKVVITFKLGEEFIDARPDGVKVKSIMTVEGDKLIQLHLEDNGMKSTHVREFSDNFLTTTTTVEGWDEKCIRIYELLK